MAIGAIQNGPPASVTAVSQATRAYYDPMDTNQDGVVSASEELAYSLDHPEWGIRTSARTGTPSLDQYAQSGVPSLPGQASSPSLNLLA